MEGMGGGWGGAEDCERKTILLYAIATEKIVLDKLYIFHRFSKGKYDLLCLSVVYLPMFGNQKSRHFHHCYNPQPPSPATDQMFSLHPVRMFFNKSVVPFTEPLPGQLPQYRSCRKILSYVWVQIDKGNFFSICRKKTWKNTD